MAIDVGKPGKGSMTLSFKPRSPAVRVVLEVVAPFRGRLLAAMGLMLLQSGVVLLAPWMIGRFSQALLLHEPVSAWLGGLLAVVVVQAALGYAVGVHLQGAASRMIEGLSLRVYAHLQVLPLAWHRERRRGAVLALLTEDVYRVGRFVTGAAIPLIPLMVMCAGAAAMMLGVQPALALAVLALVPAAFIGLRWAGRRLRPLAQQVVDAYAMTTSLAEQGLSLLPVTKAFAAEGTELQRYAESVGRLRHWEMRQVRAQDAIAPVVRVLVVAAVLAMLAWGARLVAAGSLAAADLVTLLMYGLMLGQPISQLAAVYGQVQTAKGTLHRLDDLFAQAPEPDSGQLELPAPLGEIRLEGVCFGYPGRGRVLDGVDLHVPAAGTIAIIGANGAGKSTLIQLMMRFHDPEAGRITLDGVDVRQLRLAHLRSMFGLVSQQILLLNGTVRENIAYGCPDATDPVINEAARLARASEFIAQLPDGLDTVVGDDGLRLSGGQRQRLALARALLRDPRVLILDEATAMFDPLAETAFVEEMLGRRGGRTVILVTHRPASLVLAERVYELSDGRLRLVSP